MIFHRYKLFISRWGMVLNVHGDVYDYDEYTGGRDDLNEENFFEICEGVCVHFDRTEESEMLCPADYPHMLEGFKKVSGQIVANSKFERTVIVITKIEYDMCCMQDEGFVAGMMEWASAAFGFECPQVEAAFDKEKNCYVYRFPEEK